MKKSQNFDAFFYDDNVFTGIEKLEDFVSAVVIKLITSKYLHVKSKTCYTYIGYVIENKLEIDVHHINLADLQY